MLLIIFVLGMSLDISQVEHHVQHLLKHGGVLQSKLQLTSESCMSS